MSVGGRERTARETEPQDSQWEAEEGRGNTLWVSSEGHRCQREGRGHPTNSSHQMAPQRPWLVTPRVPLGCQHVSSGGQRYRVLRPHPQRKLKGQGQWCSCPAVSDPHSRVLPTLACKHCCTAAHVTARSPLGTSIFLFFAQTHPVKMPPSCTPSPWPPRSPACSPLPGLWKHLPQPPCSTPTPIALSHSADRRVRVATSLPCYKPPFNGVLCLYNARLHVALRLLASLPSLPLPRCPGHLLAAAGPPASLSG